MEFRILGPIEIVDDHGRPVPLAGARQRALLAAFLLHANEVVPTDRLMDEVWGERLPATGAKALQVAISQLRKTLGDGFLETRPAGYAFRVRPDQLDLSRFGALREQARVDLAAGRPEQASSALRQALGLWRGPALADVAYEPFAQAEAERLEELRLVALEERIEMDLALGRQGELVGELEAFVRKHPLRERLRVLLMLALYRSGRQAEALEVYRETRRLLAEDLGLDPSSELQKLERAILRQAPELELPHAPRTAPALRSRRPRRRIAVIAALTVATTLGLVLAFRGGANTLAAVPPNSVGLIDPADNAVVDSIPVGAGPDQVATSDGLVWVLNRDSWTVSGIDVRSRRVLYTTGVLSRDVGGLAAAKNGYFVLELEPGALRFFDPRRNHFLSILMREPGRAYVPEDLAVAPGQEVWAVVGPASVARVRPSVTTSVVRRIRLSGDPKAIVAGELVWIAAADGTVSVIDPERSQVVQRLAVGRRPTAIALGYGAAWIVSSQDGAVTRISSEHPVRVEATIRVGRRPVAVAAGAGSLWVVNQADATVSRIDPATNKVTATIRTGHRPQGIAVAGGLVWVSVHS